MAAAEEVDAGILDRRHAFELPPGGELPGFLGLGEIDCDDEDELGIEAAQTCGVAPESLKGFKTRRTPRRGAVAAR